MNKQGLISLLICLCLGVNSQSWAPDGATWLYRCVNPVVPIYDGWLEVKFTNTLVSNGKTCRILDGKFYGTTANPPIPVINQNYVYCVTYENAGVVFIQTGVSRFDTIANFNALPGQGWYSFGWDTTCNQFGVNRIKHTVYDTGHVTINGHYLKRLNMSPPISSNPVYIVEKIGPLQGFLYTYYTCYKDGWARYGNFSCYKDNNFPVYSPYSAANCNFLSVSEMDQPISALFRFYPNPVIESIAFETLFDSEIRIYSPEGRNLLSTRIYPNSENSINLGHISPGIYLISCTNCMGTSFQKLIKN